MGEPASVVRGTFKRLAGKEARLALTELWGRVQSCERLTPGRRSLLVVRRALISMSATPLTSILTALSISAALTFAAFFLLVAQNSNSMLTARSTGVLFTVLLPDDTTTSQAEAQASLLRSEPWVTSVTVTSSEKARSDYIRSLGNSRNLVEGLSSTLVLPPSLTIHTKSSSATETGPASGTAKLSSRIMDLIPQAEIHENSAFRDTIHDFYLSTSRLLAILGVVLIAVALCIVSSSIKLSLYAHREEIGVLRMLGAPRGTVRAPYLVEGSILGLVGACIALILTGGVFQLVVATLGAIPLMRPVITQAQFLTYTSQLLLVVVGSLLGALGSAWAVRSFQAERAYSS